MKRRIEKLVALLCVGTVAGATLLGCGETKTESNALVESAGSSSVEESGSETGSSTTEAESEIDLSGVTLMNEGVLTIGCEVGYPPFEDFADDGTTPIGYDVDIITAVAEKLGLEANIINTAWDGIFAGIDVNYDVVCSAVTINDERKETMSFSTPYINNYQAVVIPTGSDLSITSFQDLNGMVIAVQKETTSDELMSDYKSTGSIEVEIVANEKITSCFTQLTNGEIDAVVVDSTVADGYVASNPELYTIAYLDATEEEQFGIAMGLNNSALQAAINEALAELEAEGYIADTYAYWFGTVSE